mgnify:CR=1 FL=1
MANNEKTDESVKRKSHGTREAVLNDEHIDRAPRFQNVQDVLEHIKSDKTERAYRRKQDLIEDILSGQAREDREAILSQLLAELTTKSKKAVRSEIGRKVLIRMSIACGVKTTRSRNFACKLNF